jgi:phytoene synthase
MNDMSHTKQGQADAEPVGLVLSREDLAVCRALIKDGSKSFYTASLLLPERVRAPSYAIYAFCRISDDAVDAPDAAPPSTRISSTVVSQEIVLP